MPDPVRPPLRPVALLVLIGIAWLVAAAAVVIAAGVDPASLGAGALLRYVAGLVVRLAPPLAVVLAAAELVRRAGRGDAATLAELTARTAAADAAGAAVRERLLDVDATLATIGGRLDAVRAAAGDQGADLVAAARALDGAAATLAATGTATAATARDFATILPAAQHHADALAGTLARTGGESIRQLGEVETLLAGLYVRQDELAAQVAGIAAATGSAAAAIDGRTATLRAAADDAIAASGSALDRVRDDLAAHGHALLGGIEAARHAFDGVAGPAATVAARIDHMAAATAALGGQLADHDGRTAALVAATERSFAVLDKRLAHAAAMGTATLDAFHGRMTLVRDAADAIPPRLEAARTTLAALDAGTARLEPAAAEAEALVRALGHVAAPAAALAADLTNARGALAAIEEAAHGSALGAANQLIEVLGRVREVAGTAAGTLRETLGQVVAEAEAALAAAGARTAAAAFADPIRHEIAGLEGAAAIAGEAAQATADRIAARLLGLTQAVATVERRLAEVER